MFQILRAGKLDMIQLYRLFGTQRTLCSHYETLRIPPNASQKDIRLAFIKLSKEMHPDLNKKAGHADFVKINEAYKVLSKEQSRRQYDMQIRNTRFQDEGRNIRIVYYRGSKDWDPRIYYRHKHQTHTSSSYSNAKGWKSVSQMTIALLCILFSMFGLAVQVLALRSSMAFSRESLLAESADLAETYKQIRSNAIDIEDKDQLKTFEDKLKTTGLR